MLVALADFAGDVPGVKGQLAFPAGAKVGLLEEHASGWWVGLYNGKKGYFPSTYTDDDVEEEEEEEEAPKEADKKPEQDKQPAPAAASATPKGPPPPPGKGPPPPPAKGPPPPPGKGPVARTGSVGGKAAAKPAGEGSLSRSGSLHLGDIASGNFKLRKTSEAGVAPPAKSPRSQGLMGDVAAQAAAKLMAGKLKQAAEDKRQGAKDEEWD
jgi:hypothetical protein